MKENNFEISEEKNELPTLTGATPLELATAIGKTLDDKKGQAVKVLHVEEQTSITDYFVLCTGNSSTHVKALAGELEYKIELRGVKADNVEGRANNSWIVVDYGNVIVHIFSRDAREFYNLDKLYGDKSPVIEF